MQSIKQQTMLALPCPCMVSMLQIVPSGSKERLAFLARQMDVDNLVTGHTHEFKVTKQNPAKMLLACSTRQTQC